MAALGDGRRRRGLLARLVRLRPIERFHLTRTAPAKTAPTKTKTGTVRAGGGVVWQPGPDGRPEVILVHRPKYDDWSLPKGKLHAGEDEATAALREVEEETGLRCELGEELPASRYHDRFGRPKTVRYWAMTPEPGSRATFVPNNEVDEVRWLAPGKAAALLSYDRDREILRSLRVETDRDQGSGTDHPGAGPATPSGI